MKKLYIHGKNKFDPSWNFAKVNSNGTKSQSYDLEEHLIDFDGKKVMANLRRVEIIRRFADEPRVFTFWNVPGYVAGAYMERREGYNVPVTDIQTIPEDERETIERVLKASEDLPVNFW